MVSAIHIRLVFVFSAAILLMPRAASAQSTATLHELTSITVAPASVTKHEGETQTFTATGTFSDGITEPLLPGMGTWMTRAQMPTPRRSVAAAVLDGKLYVLGGIDAGNVQRAVVEVYDPATNTWSTAAPMLNPRASFAAATIAGQIFAIGRAGDGLVERYDPAVNTWFAAPRLTIDGCDGAAVIGNNIYAVSCGEGKDWIQVLSVPGGGAWTSIRMPSVAGGHAEYAERGVAAVDGLLYFIGGRRSDTPFTTTDRVDVFDPVTVAWTTRAPLPGGAKAPGVAVIDHVIYVIGGYGGGTYAYDVVQDTWSVKSQVPTFRYNPAAAAIGPQVFVVGDLAPPEAFGDQLRFGSSDWQVAHVSQQGVATAMAGGSTSITVTAGTMTGSATFTVTAPPTVTEPATEVTATSARLNGHVSPNGLETSAFFEYAEEPARGGTLTYTSTAPIPIGAGTDPVPQTFVISGLACNTTYVHRMSASAGATVAHGEALTFTTTACGRARRNDFTGDGLADLAVFRPDSGTWYVNGASPVQWGLPGDIPVAADYSAKGKLDPAIYRPATGQWFTSYAGVVQWGLPADIPVPADYDGDGIDDIAVFRPADGDWYVRGQFTRRWGRAADIPVPADYDGDGKADLAIFRPLTGVWSIAYSSTGFATNLAIQWGQSGDLPVVGDFDGDARADLAVFRRSSGVWYIALSSSNYGTGRTIQYGLPGDIPLALDVDGDGVDEIAVYRPSGARQYPSSISFWFWYGVTGATGSAVFGLESDIPSGVRPRSRAWVPGDYDGDGRSDLVVYSPSRHGWLILDAWDGFWQYNPEAVFNGAQAVPGDYDGDGRMDPAVLKGDGTFYIALSSAKFRKYPSIPASAFDSPRPLAADFDGDGRTDPTYYEPSIGAWLVKFSQWNYSTDFALAWGLPGDEPVPADYDGDGRADFAVFRPATGEWYVRLSSTGTAGGWFVRQWGLSGDVPLAADFDGDGRADLTVFRPSSGEWYVMNPFTGVAQAPQRWGLLGDIPLVRDFDGDGRLDLTVFRPCSGLILCAEWWVRLSSSGDILHWQWGLGADTPFLRRTAME